MQIDKKGGNKKLTQQSDERLYNCIYFILCIFFKLQNLGRVSVFNYFQFCGLKENVQASTVKLFVSWKKCYEVT